MDRETLAASVAGTAAQLRLQLSDITAASQMLEQTTSEDRARAYLAVLNQGICRMLRTVGQMELLNRLTEEDEIRVFPVPTDLGVWTRELAEHARGILLGARVSLEYRGPKVLMATVDQGLVQQMLLELICVAAQPGGEVSLSLAKQEDTACFTVCGTGTQIPPEDLVQLLFPREETLPSSWGLPLARQIAELHGGSLVAGTVNGARAALVATLPLRLDLPVSHLDSPSRLYASGGFCAELVAFSQILPTDSFTPEALE